MKNKVITPGFTGRFQKIYPSCSGRDENHFFEKYRMAYSNTVAFSTLQRGADVLLQTHKKYRAETQTCNDVQ